MLLVVIKLVGMLSMYELTKYVQGIMYIFNTNQIPIK